MKVQCQICDKTLVYASLSKHILQQHYMQLRVVELSTNLLDSTDDFHYQISFPLYFQSIACPVPECPGNATSGRSLR
jgi:hypothetical protein